MSRVMNPAEVATALVIERTLDSKGDFRKVDDRLYVIKQGSTYVMINIVPWAEDRALVRVAGQLVKGVRMDGTLARELLHLNSMLRFGAFAYDPHDNLILFIHSILGGTTLDPDELLATLTDVALIADEYDDKIIEKYGGQTMRDLIEEAALDRILDADPGTFNFGGADA
jgi:hypothetical protein